MNARYEKIEFSKFEEMVNDHHASLTDIRANLKDAEYKAGGWLTAAETTALGVLAARGKCNEQGFVTLCARLGAPAAWMRSEDCPADLEETIVNRLKEDQTEQALIRVRGFDENAVVRAVLSKQYLPYNHKDLWEDVKAAVIGTKLESLEPKIWKPFVSDHMDAWILFDGVIADPDGADPRLYDGGGTGGLKPAIHIRNGEDGGLSIGIDSGFFRSYCTNGVIFNFKKEDHFKAVHRGNSKYYMRAKVSMAIAEAAKNCKLGIDKFMQATQLEIKENVLDAIVDDWGKVFRLTSKASDVWKGAIAKSATWADVVMATSDYAGTIADRENATKYEEIAGAMLFNPSNKYLR